MRINEKAMLVRLSLSSWTARKHDGEITDEVLKAHKASGDAGRFNKLLIDHAEIKKVQSANTKIKAYFWRMTLPWLDDGTRILPSALFLKFTKGIQPLLEERKQIVAEFLAAYPRLIEDARKKLNGMFKAEDYPSASEIARKFNASVDPFPIPDAADFRVAMSDEEVEAIKAGIENRVNEAFADAVKDAARRLHDCARRIAEKCAEKDEIFRDSLIGNLRELLDVLPSLNITGDQELAKAIAAAKPLAAVEPQELRDDELVRAETAKKAAALARRLRGFMA